MYAKRSDGSDLIAEFTVEPDGDTLALVIGATGPDPAAPDHAEALTTLLRRLGARGAVITTADTPTRQLITTPTALAGDNEPEKIGMRLLDAQHRTGDSHCPPEQARFTSVGA